MTPTAHKNFCCNLSGKEICEDESELMCLWKLKKEDPFLTWEGHFLRELQDRTFFPYGLVRSTGTWASIASTIADFRSPCFQNEQALNSIGRKTCTISSHTIIFIY